MKSKEAAIWLMLLGLAGCWWCLPAGFIGRYGGWTGWEPAWLGWAPAAAIGWLLACRLILLGLYDGPEVGPFRYVQILGEERYKNMDVMKFKIGLPASPAADVVKQVLTIERVPAGPFEIEEMVELGPEVREVEIKAPQDSLVSVSLTVVDDAGNVSRPVYAEFEALDTVPPELAGSYTIETVGEETIEDGLRGLEGTAVVLPAGQPADPTPEPDGGPADGGGEGGREETEPAAEKSNN